MARTVICPYCAQQAELVTGETLYPHRPDLAKRRFWLCLPCNAYVGVHPNSKDAPLGTLANAELRARRSAAHAAFDPLWRQGKRTRKGAYAWLAHRLGIPVKDCHIGMFDLETCNLVIEHAKGVV